MPKCYNNSKENWKVVYRMKGFLKFMSTMLAVFTAVIGALAVFDRLSNKNRIKGEYLECDTSDSE